MTEGQLYTIGTGLGLALLLAVSGVHAIGGTALGAYPEASLVPSSGGNAVSAPASGRSGGPTATKGPVSALPGNAAPIVLAAPAPTQAGPPAPAPTPGPAPSSSAPGTPPGAPAGPPAISGPPAGVSGPSGPPAPSGPTIFAFIGSPGAPSGIAVSSSGSVYVDTDNGSARGVEAPSKVFEFDRSGRPLDTVTVAGQAPSHVDGLGAAAVDPVDGAVYVVEVDSAQVLRISPGSSAPSTVAVTVPDVAPCGLVVDQPPCEPGVMDHKPSLSGLAFDRQGDLYITDAGQATIWKWHPGLTAPIQWYQSSDLATGDGPAGVAVDHSGDVVFSAGTTLDVSNPGGGAIYRLAATADGTPGPRSTVASFPSGARPGALAMDASGRIYAIMRGSGTIDSVSSSGVAPFSTSGSPVPLDGPAGLAVEEGRLLVTNEASSGPATHWAVLSFPIS